MAFESREKLLVLSIVSIFETSRPLGDYAACVVLNDGAGVSYGICQFTHRSGSLLEIVERYLETGATAGRAGIESELGWLKKTTPAAIRRLAGSDSFRQSLVAAAATPEMRGVQDAVAYERYLRPSVEICAKRGFIEPLSLAVVYDSAVHGSWGRIASLVDAPPSERPWITAYVRRRHAWLSRVPRLKATNYRTRFFLDQLAVSNWKLRLPLNVHGVRIDRVPPLPVDAITETEVEPATQPVQAISQAETPVAPPPETLAVPAPNEMMSAAASRFDRVDGVISAVADRTDRAKSLWTTVGGTLWQTLWAIGGYAAGVPREIWLAAALIVAALMLLYLYRQVILGRIRETKER